ncbi:PepSY-associated TM helix domain-containing protein [Methylovulum psychrotolerans]|uniref:PepSY domain-containing protein n=1 Tax=Methylovulum psychrotolerans TaxID=1704499 RepID=A0A2S5CMK2_9GAMM|nr:PepSY-associated TM helix domain-containing protein [Methylovulum psychrotolerans]POZ52008.1 PepSY domain-containing protein [Methylovulum psychrotolerans]
MKRTHDGLSGDGFGSAVSLTKNQLVKLKTRRKFWLDVHLWLGLLLGLLLAVYGATGSILVFHTEIDELLNPGLLKVRSNGGYLAYKPLADIFEVGKSALPIDAKQTFATYPRNDEAAFQLAYLVPALDGKTEIWQVYVNPYTAQIVGKRLMGASDNLFPSTFIGFVFELHYSLLLKEEFGAVVVGVSAALLIISVLTGLIVWWPLTGRWLQALTVKRKASSERLNYDLHKTSGFYTALVMLPVLFSGIYMVLPQNVVPVLEVFSPVTYRYWFRSTPVAGEQAISMDKAVAIVDQRYPKGRPHWIYGAPNIYDTYTVCKDGVDRPGSWLQRICVVVDRYSGKILDIDDPADASVGDVFTHWQWPLHSGQAFGWAGRILVFVTGLACPVLFITGLIRWLQKKNAKSLCKSNSNKNTHNSFQLIANSDLKTSED